METSGLMPGLKSGVISGKESGLILGLGSGVAGVNVGSGKISIVGVGTSVGTVLGIPVGFGGSDKQPVINAAISANAKTSVKVLFIYVPSC
jgi:hypothetical protein